MKTLIINGSPRLEGDTAALLAELKSNLSSETAELSAYYSGIKPCTDCRCCWTYRKCVINDDMREIYNDDFDNVVIASPVYMSTLPGPLVGLISRMQVFYAAKHFLKEPFKPKNKKGALILVGGGDGSPDEAVRLAGMLFRYVNARDYTEHTVMSLSTDSVPARTDASALEGIRRIVDFLNKP